MPNVTATPRPMSDGTTVTSFVDSVDTGGVTYTYPNTNDVLMIYNNGIVNLTVTVGITTITVVPGDTQSVSSPSFISFVITAASGLGSFRARATQNIVEWKANPNIVQGLYQRVLTNGNLGAAIRALTKDPVVPGRVWGIGLANGWVGYTDDNGVSFVTKTANPDANVYGIQTLLFSTTYAWLLTGGGGSQQGRLFRSPLPNASGNGLSWTLMFDLSTFPGGVNSNFRNSCVAVSEPNVYLVEYGPTTVTGGPSIYVSSNSGTTFTKAYTWVNAKHCHAVKIIGGVPWVQNGDGGFSDLGLWAATTVGGTVWSRKSIYGYDVGGNYLYGVNFFPIKFNGYDMIVTENDTHFMYGPLLYPSIDKTSSMTMIPLCSLRAPYVGTIRQLTPTSEGNIMWVSTGENGAVGPCESIWIAKPPFHDPVLLEEVPLNTFSTLGDPVENGKYIFFGNFRITKEKFIGQ